MNSVIKKGRTQINIPILNRKRKKGKQMFGNDNRRDSSDTILFAALTILITGMCSMIARLVWPLIMKTLRAAGNGISYVIGRIIR